MELEELYKLRRSYEDARDDFLSDSSNHTGDQCYQDLLGDLEAVEEDIERLEKELK